MHDRALARRWQAGEGPRLAALVLDRLLAGEPLSDLTLGRCEGRVDLRGFATPTPRVLGTSELVGDETHTGLGWLGGLIEFRGVALSDLDLSGSRLENLRFFDTTVRNCRFDSARCRDWRGWSLVVEQCTFRQADLRDSALGTWYEGNGNQYRDVDFGAADLRGIACQGSGFEDCDFAGAYLDKVEFGGCRFLHCRFVGRLDEVIFSQALTAGTGKPEPGILSDVDFSAATMYLVEFRDLSLEGVIPPPDGGEHVVSRHYPCVVRRALDRLAENSDASTRRLRARLQTDASRLTDGRDIGIWHLDELGRNDNERRFAAALLREVDRECAAGE
jgi:hypothetical protein